MQGKWTGFTIAIAERLYALAADPKTLLCVPGGRHVESMSPRFGDTYRDRLVAFFEDALARPTLR